MTVSSIPSPREDSPPTAGQISFSGPPFVRSSPRPQNAIALFGDWASRFPDATGIHTKGNAGLFEDPKMTWLEEALRRVEGGGVQGRRLLELGPLEAGHTYMLDRLGAKSIDAIEANGLAFLKCLVVKEALGIPSARFKLGDAVAFLENGAPHYDLGVCSGFLYHMPDPLHLLRLLAACCDRLYVWTITYGEELFTKRPDMRARFGPPRLCVDAGFSYRLYPHFYGEVPDYSQFWGGIAPSSCWMSADDIVGALKHVGYDVVEVQGEDNPFGLALNVLATKRGHATAGPLR